MDILLVITGIMLMTGGIAGCALPVLPGPPLSYAGLLMLHFTAKHEFSLKFLAIWAFVTLAVTLLDYFIPVWGAKKFGAGRAGVWGSIIGLLAGLFLFPPFGIIVGPFVGAVLGELTGGKDTLQALKAGFGSFAGFMGGVLLKLIASGMMTWYFIKMIISGA